MSQWTGPKPAGQQTRLNPGRIFDYETGLEHIGDAYQAMDERRAIKSLVRVGTV